MKLSNIKFIGRYKDLKTGNEYNVYTGRNQQRGTDHLFYFKMMKRELITDRDFYSGNWQKVSD